jgi:predicted Zn-dependent protease
MRSFLVIASLALACVLVGVGCRGLGSLSELGTSIAVATGTMTPEEAHSLNRVSSAVGKTFQDITPEQEYYIGRSVAATILGQYRPFDDTRANQYVNTLGQALALASDRPETFGGYHFLILDADEINAFAAPGGLILVSRGLLRCCRTEDEAAAVLAHEITHVAHQHGLQAISKDRLASAALVIAAESAKQFGSQDLARLTQEFGGTVDEITSTLVNSGYSRKLERDADAGAVAILKAIGYNPAALVAMLNHMDKARQPNGPGFAKTHPSPKDRIADVQRLIGGATGSPALPERLERFQKALGGI